MKETECKMCKGNSESLSSKIEKILNPEYMNSVFTWAQIEKALKKVTDYVDSKTSNQTR